MDFFRDMYCKVLNFSIYLAVFIHLFIFFQVCYLFWSSDFFHLDFHFFLFICFSTFLFYFKFTNLSKIFFFPNFDKSYFLKRKVYSSFFFQNKIYFILFLLFAFNSLSFESNFFIFFWYEFKFSSSFHSLVILIIFFFFLFFSIRKFKSFLEKDLPTHITQTFCDLETYKNHFFFYRIYQKVFKDLLTFVYNNFFPCFIFFTICITTMLFFMSHSLEQNGFSYNPISDFISIFLLFIAFFFFLSFFFNLIFFIFLDIPFFIKEENLKFTEKTKVILMAAPFEHKIITAAFFLSGSFASIHYFNITTGERHPLKPDFLSVYIKRPLKMSLNYPFNVPLEKIDYESYPMNKKEPYIPGIPVIPGSAEQLEFRKQHEQSFLEIFDQVDKDPAFSSLDTVQKMQLARKLLNVCYSEEKIIRIENLRTHPDYINNPGLFESRVDLIKDSSNKEMNLILEKQKALEASKKIWSDRRINYTGDRAPLPKNYYEESSFNDLSIEDSPYKEN